MFKTYTYLHYLSFNASCFAILSFQFTFAIRFNIFILVFTFIADLTRVGRHIRRKLLVLNSRQKHWKLRKSFTEFSTLEKKLKLTQPIKYKLVFSGTPWKSLNLKQGVQV